MHSQEPDRLIGARMNVPLIVGIGEGENFLASDVAAFIEHTREALELGQDQVVTITREGVEVTGFDGSPAEGTRYHVDWDLSAAEKDGYDWFMRKEIFEQPRAVRDSLLGRHDDTGRLQLDELRMEPLLVVDGIPLHSESFASALSGLLPQDILRYTVGVDHPDQVVRTARRSVTGCVASRRARVTIHLGRALPLASCDLPGGASVSRGGRATQPPARSCSGRGLPSRTGHPMRW